MVEIGYGLLLQVGVIGVQGFAQGCFGVGGGGDVVEEAADVAHAAGLDDGFDGGERPGVGERGRAATEAHPGTFEAREAGSSPWPAAFSSAPAAAVLRRPSIYWATPSCNHVGARL